MTEINTEIESFLTKHGKSKGIPRSTISTLKRFGIFDAKVLIVLSKEEIQRIPSVSAQTAEALKRLVFELLNNKLFQTGAEFIEIDLKTKKYFITGSKNLDKLLGEE